MEIARQFEAADSPDEQRAIVTQLVRTAVGLPNLVSPRSSTSAAGRTALERTAASISICRRVLDLLPREKAASAGATLERIAGRLAQARSLPEFDAPANKTALAALAAELDRANPLRGALEYSPAARPDGAAPLGPRGDRRRHHARAGLGAYPRNNAGRGSRGAAACPGIRGRLRRPATDPAALAVLGRQITAKSDDELFGRHAARFGSDRVGSDAAVHALRRGLLNPIVLRELPRHALQGWARDAPALLAAVRADPVARVELERLF